jgi:hypothetical protein
MLKKQIFFIIITSLAQRCGGVLSRARRTTSEMFHKCCKKLGLRICVGWGRRVNMGEKAQLNGELR